MQKKQESTGLVWFGNDLRVADNNVLAEAIRNNKEVVGVYCLPPSFLEKTNFGFQKLGAFRAKFLLESLEDLKKNLFQLNISLLFYLDTPENIIPKLCQEYNIDKVYKQKEWTADEEIEKRKVQKCLGNVEIVEIYNQFLYHPTDILSDPQKIPNVFSSFRKKIEKYIAIQPECASIESLSEDNLRTVENSIPSLSKLGYTVDELDTKSAFPYKGGETSAKERLHDYFFVTKKLGFYKKTRNGLIGTDYSSKFSPWLANGCISAKTIYWQVKKFEKEIVKNQSTYWLVFELIWRDYFKYISMKYGNEIFKLGGILNKDYSWNSDEDLVQKWINGETGDDFVNANMIELKKTGWMSNRGRQNVASYFAKELFIDWRIGAAYFEQQLLDYDVHSNYGNWMYVSGVGNDPRDRKFNTQLQADRYDANGAYRKMWLQSSLF